MSDIGIEISDELGVTVEESEPEEETRAEVADTATAALVSDPVCAASIEADLTDCLVILTSL
jgi:hypothetical protein